VRTFDDMLRTALVDIARRAEPVDLTDAALEDITRRSRTVALMAGVAVVFTLGVGLLVGLAAGPEAPPGRFQPNGAVPDQRGDGSSPGCGSSGAAPTPTCSTPQVSATLAASASASPSRSASPSPSGKVSPSSSNSTTSGTDEVPGNRPRPKPSKPGRAG
jgi:hypothetical protein